MTLAQLRAAIEARGYGPDSANHDIFINGVYRRLNGKRRWPWTETQGFLAAVVGNPDVAVTSLPSFLAIDAVRIEFGTDYRNLEYIDPQAFRDRQHTNRTSSTPYCWTYFDDKIRLYPTPDRAFTVIVEYSLDVPDLVAPTDVPVFPATFHEILVEGAVAEMAMRQRDDNAYAISNQRYEQLLVEMERAVGIRQRQTPTQVRRSAFWDNVGRP